MVVTSLSVVMIRIFSFLFGYSNWVSKGANTTLLPLGTFGERFTPVGEENKLKSRKKLLLTNRRICNLFKEINYNFKILNFQIMHDD